MRTRIKRKYNELVFVPKHNYTKSSAREYVATDDQGLAKVISNGYDKL